MFVCDSSPIFEHFYNLIMYFQGVNQDDLGHFWDAFLEKREVVPSRNLWGPWGEPCEMTLWVWGYLWSKLRPDAYTVELQFVTFAMKPVFLWWLDWEWNSAASSENLINSMVFSVHPIFGNHVPNQGIIVVFKESWSLYGPSFLLSPKLKPK